MPCQRVCMPDVLVSYSIQRCWTWMRQWSEHLAWQHTFGFTTQMWWVVNPDSGSPMLLHQGEVSWVGYNEATSGACLSQWPVQGATLSRIRITMLVIPILILAV